jgi:hypothetical protein
MEQGLEVAVLGKDVGLRKRPHDGRDRLTARRSGRNSEPDPRAVDVSLAIRSTGTGPRPSRATGGRPRSSKRRAPRRVPPPRTPGESLLRPLGEAGRAGARYRRRGPRERGWASMTVVSVVESLSATWITDKRSTFRRRSNECGRPRRRPCDARRSALPLRAAPNCRPFCRFSASWGHPFAGS